VGISQIADDLRFEAALMIMRSTTYLDQRRCRARSIGAVHAFEAPDPVTATRSVLPLRVWLRSLAATND
jgi:hypothetical protein